MGLASGGGGGGSSGGGFASGYLLGRMLSEDDDSGLGVIALGVITVLVVGGVMVGVMLDDTPEYKDELNALICEKTEFKSVDVSYFDWYVSNEDEYVFKFTGSAINNFDEKVDFFACSYEVSEKNYYDILTYIEQNNIEDLDTKGLLQKLIEIVKESELKDTNTNTNVSMDVEEDVLILDVSKPRIVNGKVKYLVCHAQKFETEEGYRGIKTTVNEVSYDLTPELEKNPAGVFLMSKDKATVRKVKSNVIPLEVLDQVYIHAPNKDRVKIVSKGKPVTKSRM